MLQLGRLNHAPNDSLDRFDRQVIPAVEFDTALSGLDTWMICLECINMLRAADAQRNIMLPVRERHPAVTTLYVDIMYFKFTTARG